LEERKEFKNFLEEQGVIIEDERKLLERRMY